MYRKRFVVDLAHYSEISLAGVKVRLIWGGFLMLHLHRPRKLPLVAEWWLLPQSFPKLRCLSADTLPGVDLWNKMVIVLDDLLPLA